MKYIGLAMSISKKRKHTEGNGFKYIGLATFIDILHLFTN